MDASILIPTYNRPEKAAACIRCLAEQSVGSVRYEVVIGLDGPDERTCVAVEDAWKEAGGAAGGLVVIECPRSGYNAVRNAILERAKGKILISLNDDVLPAQGFVKSHVLAHAEQEAAGRPAVIAGRSLFVAYADDMLFDRLVRETSMIFFYDQMSESQPDRDWGYRHAWGLNVSAPTDAIREVGGWTAFHLAYGYDDVEIAHRLRERYDMPVLYRPDADAPHDHRYKPDEYLKREFRLGHSALYFARQLPEFCCELFGRDIREDAELDYSRQFTQRERPCAARLCEVFLKLDAIPCGAIGGDHAQTLIQMLYQQHLLLKRWMWRAGLVAAAEGAAQDDVRWPE